MPYLNSIVDRLNEDLVTALNPFMRADKGSKGEMKTYGITEQIISIMNEGIQGQEKQMQYPGVVNNDGEVEAVEIDDIYSVISYHRLDSIINGSAPLKQQFGRVPTLAESINMGLVVISFRRKILQPSWWLEGVIKDKFPSGYALTTQVSSLKVSSSSFDKIGLLKRDFIGIELNYSEISIFEMKYRIESNYKKGCFDICGTECVSTS